MTNFVIAKKYEELFGLEVSYLSAIGVLMYLVNCTHPDIVFFYQFISKIQFRSNSKTLEWYQIYITLSFRNY